MSLAAGGGGGGVSSSLMEQADASTGYSMMNIVAFSGLGVILLALIVLECCIEPRVVVEPEDDDEKKQRERKIEAQLQEWRFPDCDTDTNKTSTEASDDHENQCAICLSDFTRDDTLCCSDNCEHKFHFDCMKSWLIKNQDCPLCRCPYLDASSCPGDNV